MSVIVVNTQDRAQRFQIAEKILRLYEAGEISTRRCFELLERLYVLEPTKQKWNWPTVYVTSDLAEGK